MPYTEARVYPSFTVRICLAAFPVQGLLDQDNNAWQHTSLTACAWCCHRGYRPRRALSYHHVATNAMCSPEATSDGLSRPQSHLFYQSTMQTSEHVASFIIPSIEHICVPKSLVSRTLSSSLRPVAGPTLWTCRNVRSFQEPAAWECSPNSMTRFDLLPENRRWVRWRDENCSENVVTCVPPVAT
jgi:hypothetical protein